MPPKRVTFAKFGGYKDKLTRMLLTKKLGTHTQTTKKETKNTEFPNYTLGLPFW
jgi:hypothetical protein